MNNKKTIITAIVTLVVGLLLGWLIFGGSEAEPADEHLHDTEVAEETTWTCSMHPQIRQSEPGDCPICGMDLIPLENENNDEGLDPNAISMSPTAMQLANIQTAIVGNMDSVKKVRLNGKVQSDERLVYSQSSHIPGRIENLMVNFTGEYVQKGQVIASIYSPDLVTAQEELFEAQNIGESQPALFRAAQEKLKNWKLTEEQIQQILESGAVQENFEIRADVSGYVAEKIVNTGDYISRGQAIYKIADLTRVWILFDVYESDMPWVNQGEKVAFTIASLPGKTFEGEISFIDPVIDPKTRVAKARVVVANPNLALKPEMFASGVAEAQLSGDNEALVVPKSAVMWTGKRSVVYIKSSSEQGVNFIMREVTLGPALGESYVIESGLMEGEEIAVNGTFSIDAAAQLAGKPSMMQRPESKTMEVPQLFRQQITEVARAYFNIKNALVNDDPETAQKAAGKVSTTIENVNMQQLEEEAHQRWMPLQKKLKGASAMISANADIEKQREHFNTLSDAMLETTESFGLEIDKTYRQFCPMAFDDKGAFWLSESEEVLNPYFGDMMLRCGEVKQTYHKGQATYLKDDSATQQAGSHHH
ncbi:efflux RND transporter periplasmic adaptor subunit [Roseimarinus sediminis]|uniref:efflux RND transporter periplasmic adaptor subunit n=1 Tax=Roseimarinus sediminis TaxID=1610899 RepID=UPI003D2253D9